MTDTSIPIELPYGEENKCHWYEKVVHGAQERIFNFAKNHDWEEHVSTPLVKRVWVFDSKEQFDNEVKSTFGYDQHIQLPKSFSGIVSDSNLMVVAPDIYASNYQQGQEGNAYEKLLAHEMAHELHIRILDGEEDLMGPRWFFEGFALYAADQFRDTPLELTNGCIRDIVSSDQSVTYAYYRLLVDKLLLFINLNKAVSRAKEDDFVGYVRDILKV